MGRIGSTRIDDTARCHTNLVMQLTQHVEAFVLIFYW